MIWHIILAALLTWLVLIGLTRATSYLYFELAGMPDAPPQLLLFFTAIVLAPLVALVLLVRRLVPRRRRIVTVDMRVLSKDEQRHWMERLDSEEDTEQVVREAVACAREVQETRNV